MEYHQQLGHPIDDLNIWTVWRDTSVLLCPKNRKFDTGKEKDAQ